MDELKATTLADRFGGFAGGHFALSGVSAVLVTFVLPRLLLLPFSSALSAVSVAGLMVFYFPVGMLVAAENRWTVPANDRERLLAVLLPALGAWTWGGAVVAVLFGGALDSGSAGGLAAALIMGTWFLACPSSVFVVFCLAMTGGAMSESPVFWGLLAFAAGLLPPLLFALGAFWQSARQSRRTEQ